MNILPVERKYLALLDSLGRLVEKSSNARSIESLLPEALEAALQFSGMDSGAIYLVADVGEILHLMAETGFGAGEGIRRKRLVSAEGITGKAYSQRKTLLVEDIEKDPEWSGSGKKSDIRSQISLPLMSGGQTMGVLDLNDREPHAFTPEETSWLQTLSGQLAVLFLGSRFFIQAQASAVQLTRLYDFGSRILAATTLQQALELTTRFALLATAAHSSAVYLTESDGRIRLSHGVDFSGRDILDGDTPCPEETIRVCRTAEKAVVMHTDELEPGPYADSLRAAGIVALAGLPLKSNLQSIGALFVFFSAPHAFSQTELEGMALYAVQAAGAIERLRLLEESRQREADLRMIVDMARAITSTLDLEELLQQIAVLLVWTARMDACVISSVDFEQGQLRTLAAYSAFGERADKDFGAGFALADFPATEQVLRGSDPVLLSAEDRSCPAGEAADLRRLRYNAVLLLPLWAGGKALGLVRLYSRRADLVLPAIEIQKLRVPAEQAALALVNARLYESERQQRILAETLRDIGVLLSGSLKAGTILETLLKEIERVIPFDSANVMLLQGDRLRVAAHRGYERFGLADWIARLDVPIENLTGIHRMAMTRQPFVISDVQSDSTWQPAGPSWHVGSWVGAPLVARDQLLGFLSMDKAERGYYSTEHAARLESLAGHAALALLNALTFGEVEQASITDFVTGIYNRRYFQEQLQLEIDRARRIGYPVSLLILDLDHFKRVNDTYGHPCGDRILQMVARRIKDELRAVDILARYGGEEFAVILPGTPATSITGVGERLRQVIGMRPFMVDEQAIAVTVSAGGATFPDDADEAQSLIDESDRLLYVAKDAGRNKLKVAAVEPWLGTSGSAMSGGQGVLG